MNNNPIYLSVVLSTYNDETYIKKTIESILSQTYPYFEFIIVNDGSTDRTLDIVKSFDDERIVVIDKPNTGLPDSLNRGFSIAQYDWIARMDGDDIALPDRFEKQVPFLQEDIAVLGAQVEYMDVDEIVFGQSNLPTSNKGIKNLMNLFSSAIIHPTAIINKEKFLKTGGYDHYLFGSEDYDLWYRIGHFGKLKNIKDKVLKYRLNPQGVSLSKNQSQILKGMVACIKNHKKMIGCLDQNSYDSIVEELQKNYFYKRFADEFNKFENKKGIARRLSYLYILILKQLTLYSIKG